MCEACDVHHFDEGSPFLNLGLNLWGGFGEAVSEHIDHGWAYLFAIALEVVVSALDELAILREFVFPKDIGLDVGIQIFHVGLDVFKALFDLFIAAQQICQQLLVLALQLGLVEAQVEGVL
jgi:hypothetical protein